MPAPALRELAPEAIVRLEEDDPAVVLLDQRRLPQETVELRCRSAGEVAEAIRSMAVRGAPAIGVAAAYGLARAARRGPGRGRAPARRLEADRGQPPLGAGGPPRRPDPRAGPGPAPPRGRA